MEHTLTIKEVAEHLRVSTRSVRRLIANDTLPAFNTGTAIRPRWRINQTALRSFKTQRGRRRQ